MAATTVGFRLSAATGIHRGDRAYQQDQVQIFPHSRVAGCVMAVLADGMGGKSGGRKAADQVILTSGACANPGLGARLRETGIPVHEVGDCTGVGYIDGAIRSGFDLAFRL